MTSRISFIALILITLGLMSATVVEKYLGSEVAARFCYHSPWMIALWFVAATTALATVIARRKAMTVAVLWLHLSFILILAGAAVTHFTGEQGHITLNPDEPTSSFTLDDGSTRQLPLSLTLRAYGTEYYPGTLSACDYYSSIDISDGNTTHTHRISMNHPLDFGGYSFCQSGIGADISTLSVNHDPWGIGITFAGYGLLFLSMTVELCERRGRFRRNLRRLMATSALMVLFVTSAMASSGPDMPETLQRPLAKTFGELYISDGERVQPLQTFAYNLLANVYGKDRYKGLTPEQFVTGWIFYYDTWKHEPVIRLKSRLARNAMGGDEYVSLAQLYAGGEYRLEKLLRDNPDDRNLAADDNRVALLTTLCTGSALRTIPLKGPTGTIAWYSWADRLPATCAPDEAEDVTNTLSQIYYDVNHGQFCHANEQLKHFITLQQSLAGETLPSAEAIRAERLYNTTFYPLLSAVFTLITGILSLLVYLYDRHRALPAVKTAVWIAFAYTTYIIILRWIAGGHIPLATGYETMLALAWIALALSHWCGQRVAVMLPLGVIVAGAALLVAMMGSKNPAMGALMPVLASRLLSLHVMLVMTSYSLFGIMALGAGIGLASPSRRERMALVCDTLLTPALFLLGAGIFTGAIWANQSWGRYWGWDPKETWALITFIIYALPLHGGIFRQFGRQKYMLAYLLIAFLSVLMTYLGVNYLLSGLHSYGTA